MVIFQKGGFCILIFSGNLMHDVYFVEELLIFFLLQLIHPTNIVLIFCYLLDCVEFWRKRNKYNIIIASKGFVCMDRNDM